MPLQKQKLALFDICHTVVKVTTVADFVENCFLSKKCNPRASLCWWIYHRWYKVLRRLHLTSPETYRAHYIRLFQGALQGQVALLARAYADRLQELIKPEVKERMDAYRNQGYEVVFVTAGFDAYLGPFAELMGARLIATSLEQDGLGRYTGHMEGSDCVGVGKVQKLQEVFSFGDVDWQMSAAFGDSLSDVPMMSLTGNAFAVDPEPSLDRYAKEQGWVIIRT